MSEQFKRQLAEGDSVLRRLSKIAIAARPSSAADPEVPKISSAKAVAAAAQALRGHPLYIEGNEEKLASFVADGICRWEGTFTLKMYKGERDLLEDEDRIYGIFSRYIS